MSADDRLYFRQLLSGQDFAIDDPVAAQMVNFAYLIGDRQTGEALIVDPAYAVDELVDAVEVDGLRVVGALATHHHPDHVGGTIMGHRIDGVSQLLARMAVPVHANEHEVDAICRITGAGPDDVVGHAGGEAIRVGAIDIQCLHTPGHTPGSQCFMVDGMLVSGDTLFLDGCGRTDLPGSDPGDMYDSLRRLAALPDDTAVFPGHHYSAPSAGSMESVRASNVALRPMERSRWVAMFSPG